MSSEQNKALFRRAIEAANAGDYATVWDLFTEDCEIIDHTGTPKTKQEFKADMEAWYNAAPDFHVKVEDVIADGDRVAGRYTETGTWTGPFMGMEPTGKAFSYPAIEIWRITNGKITGMWMARDLLTWSTQMGIVPATG